MFALSACALATVAAVSGSLALAAPAQTDSAVTSANFPGMEFLPGSALPHLKNGTVKPLWQPDGSFAYRRDTETGTVWIIVDAATGRSRAAFDAAAVAAGLSKALGEKVEPGALPFESFAFATDKAIRVAVGEGIWKCSIIGTPGCTAEATATVEKAPGVLSPDRRFIAYLKEGNLRVRAVDGSGDRALTSDALPDYAYGGSTGNNTSYVTSLRSGVAPAPLLLWSPDSRKILTHRIDERGVKQLTLLESVPGNGVYRPKAWTWRYSMAGEPRALQEMMVFDALTGARTDIKTSPSPLSFTSYIERFQAWWSEDGAHAYLIETGSYARTLTLHEVDASTGAVRSVLKEIASNYLDQGPVGSPPMVRAGAGDDVIWYSDRDGYGHLYRYDLKSGKLRNRITSGPWMVREIVRYDAVAGLIFFTASGRETGRNPYFRKLYSVGVDGRGLRLLTPEDAEHNVHWGISVFEPDPLGLGKMQDGFAPDGGVFIDTYSRADLAPVSVLRKGNGALVGELEQGRLVGLNVPEIARPVPFEVLAADGKTKLYGMLYRPLNFDPARKYPLVDSVYAGPQARRVEYDFSGALFGRHRGLLTAQNGLVTFVLDARGTPDRSREFAMYTYGKLSNSGLDDHVAAIRQLGERYAYIDTSRVGIWGASGGGFAAARAMMTYPEIFKAGVSISGNHEQRGYIPIWAETYDGPDAEKDLAAASNPGLAGGLKGKLLLIHGEMDDNVHPAHTMQLVDGLIKADKDFDLLIVPGANHSSARTLYVWRRMTEYLVLNLGAEGASR